MAVKSYSPGNVIVVIGPFILKSWEEIEVEYDEDKWKFETGIYDETTRLKNGSSLGTIKITMKQTSVGNTINTGLYALISDTIDLAGVIPVFVHDFWNKPLHVMTTASIVKMPKATYSKRVSERVWTFKGELDVNSLVTN